MHRPSSVERAFDALAHGRASDAMTELLRESARTWAEQLRTLQELDDLTVLGARAGTAQSPQLEMAGSFHVSQHAATRWMWEAERFAVALPGTFALLESGELLEHQARVLLHRTRHCPTEIARAVEAEVLPAAAGLCPADLGRRVDRVVLRIEAEQDGAAAAQRQADAAASRRTFAALPAMVLAGTAQDRATEGPRVPWALGPEQPAAQVVINVHVPVATVLELSREPGSVHRYGPVSAEHIRLLRPHSWRRVMVDARSGRPIAVDDHCTPAARPTPAPHATPDAPAADPGRAQVQEMLRPDVVVDADEPRHDPSARLARLVDLRDVRCCGPGCSTTHTHRDHLVPHLHGPTSARNLGRVSPRCHQAKHAGWSLQRHRDGSVTWTRPLGRSCSRPSPHSPPPRVDLTEGPPPRRPRAVGPTDDDRHLRPEDLVPPADASTSGEPDDEPPPF